jgi:hypothetical protein
MTVGYKVAAYLGLPVKKFKVNDRVKLEDKRVTLITSLCHEILLYIVLNLNLFIPIY